MDTVVQSILNRTSFQLSEVTIKLCFRLHNHLDPFGSKLFNNFAHATPIFGRPPSYLNAKYLTIFESYTGVFTHGDHGAEQELRSTAVLPAEIAVLLARLSRPLSHDELFRRLGIYYCHETMVSPITHSILQTYCLPKGRLISGLAKRRQISLLVNRRFYYFSEKEKYLVHLHSQDYESSFNLILAKFCKGGIFYNEWYTLMNENLIYLLPIALAEILKDLPTQFLELCRLILGYKAGTQPILNYVSSLPIPNYDMVALRMLLNALPSFYQLGEEYKCLKASHIDIELALLSIFVHYNEYGEVYMRHMFDVIRGGWSLLTRHRYLDEGFTKDQIAAEALLHLRIKYRL